VGPSSLSEQLLPPLDCVWGGDVTLAQVAAGNGSSRNAGAPSCVNSAFDDVVGETVDYRLSIAHTGSKLTAKLVSSGTGTGLTCDYEGETGSHSSMVLHSVSCMAPPLNFKCPGVADPAFTMTLKGSTLTATFNDPINVTQIQGSVAFNFNVNGSDPSAVVSNHVFTNFTRR